MTTPRDLTITLNAIRQHSPCEYGWKKLLAGLGKTKADDEPVSFRQILKINGLADALWCLRVLPESYDGDVRLLACDFAQTAMKYVPEGEKRPQQAIDVARRYARGEASRDELMAAEDAARAAAEDAARAAARAAAEDAARAAAWDAAEDAARAAAWAAARSARAAAWDAAEAAAWAAAWAAARSARAAAEAAAWAAARSARAAAEAAARAGQRQIFLDWLDRATLNKEGE